MDASFPNFWRCKLCGDSQLNETSSAVNCLNCNSQYVLHQGVWECEDGFTPDGFSIHRSDHLQNIENGHFWFAARDRLLHNKIVSLKRASDQNLLELGCGSGRNLGSLGGVFASLTGIEGHKGALEKATKNCPKCHFIHSDVLQAPLVDKQFDWVVAFDVLEHVDASDFIEEAYRLCRPGGRLLVSVPAFPLLWSHVDTLAGHRCRYRLKLLTEELEAAGWIVQGHTYFQFLLFPLLAISRIFQRNKHAHIERRPPKFINRFLSFINQGEVRLFHRFSLPFGSSLIVWAERPVSLERQQGSINE